MKNEELEKENQMLRSRLEKITGKKVRLERRVTIPLTELEYQKIQKLSQEKGKPKSQILRSALFGDEKPKLALE